MCCIKPRYVKGFLLLCHKERGVIVLAAGAKVPQSQSNLQVNLFFWRSNLNNYNLNVTLYTEHAYVCKFVVYRKRYILKKWGNI